MNQSLGMREYLLLRGMPYGGGGCVVMSALTTPRTMSVGHTRDHGRSSSLTSSSGSGIGGGRIGFGGGADGAAYIDGGVGGTCGWLC